MDRRQRERGLTNDQLRQLPCFKLDENETLCDEMRHECCSICLDSLVDGGSSGVIRELAGCGHLFHRDCIDAWLLRKGECPNCKSNQARAINISVQSSDGRSTSVQSRHSHFNRLPESDSLNNSLYEI